MQTETQRRRGTIVRYTLSFYGTLGFIAGFSGARLFATLNPTLTVARGGIHFHHFWYGLAIVVVTGWLGIVIATDRLGRLLAALFGLGVGFIGDEVGLLLTFGEYQSEITAWFFAGAISAIILVTLLLRFRGQLEKDIFILVGDRVNFTQKAIGGTPPYVFVWNFGDGGTSTGATVLHTYSVPNAYTVTLNVTDSSGQSSLSSLQVTVNEWPVSTATAFGWVIPWNLTRDDGVNIWNVTYHGNSVIHDARLAAIESFYLNNICGPFYMEAYNMTGVKADGNISYYQNQTDTSNPYFQLTAEYRVGGEDFTEAFRFYKNGVWEPILTVGLGGCAAIQWYEPHWRIDLAPNPETANYMSMYTSQGAWQDLLWEGNYTDNGFRDLSHNSSIWRITGQNISYYIKPQIIRPNLNLPSRLSDLILVRDHPNEIEVSHAEVGHIESPTEWVNGEPAFRRDIAFWWVPTVYVYGPALGVPPNPAIIALVFYPGGA